MLNIRFHQFGPCGHAQSVNSVDGNVVSNMAMLMNRVGSSDTWEREGSGVALWVSGYNIGQGNYPASQRHSGARTRGWTDGGRTKKPMQTGRKQGWWLGGVTVGGGLQAPRRHRDPETARAFSRPSRNSPPASPPPPPRPD